MPRFHLCNLLSESDCENFRNTMRRIKKSGCVFLISSTCSGACMEMFAGQAVMTLAGLEYHSIFSFGNDSRKQACLQNVTHRACNHEDSCIVENITDVCNDSAKCVRCPAAEDVMIRVAALTCKDLSPAKPMSKKCATSRFRSRQAELQRYFPRAVRL